MMETKLLKIAFAQILPGKNLAENQALAEDACQKAKKMEADIVLFPEMFSCGYYFFADYEKLALDEEDEFLQCFQTLAKELNLAICMTYLKKTSEQPENSAVLFDRHGKRVLDYSKVHTCAFADEKVLRPGQSFPVCQLDTEKGTVMTGCMICFDREFPESARILMLQGAELILAPNACCMEMNRLCALRTRAYENKTAIATCNYPSPHPEGNGHSSLFDGIAWKHDETGSRDMCMLEASENPGIVIGCLDLDALKKYRKEEAMGEKYRHPQAYSLLSQIKEEN